eukprot:COSAG01_NODE_11991_length_1820_cov_281.757118_2_plen_470_part_01
MDGTAVRAAAFLFFFRPVERETLGLQAVRMYALEGGVSVGPPPWRMSAALAAELGALKMGALSRRATAAGVDEDALEAAVDDADKAALIALIVAKEVDPAEELRAELRALKLGALSKRAAAAGVDADAIEAALDDADKAAIIELIVAQAAAIPEGVPSEPINLHTVGQASAMEPECEPETELGRPPPAKRAPPRPTGSLPSSHRAFGSMRFDGVVPAHAEQLRAAMQREGADLEIINMTGGGDIDLAVQEGILAADFFVVFGSAKYGEDTGNAACTYYESKFAQSRGKKIILIRMIPFDQDFEFSQGKFMFGLNMLVLPWMLGAPMPAELPGQILEAMGLRGGGQGASASPSPSSPQPSSSAVAAPITTVAGAAAAAGVAEDELLGYSRDELTELLKQLGVSNVVARSKLLKQSDEAVAARLTALCTSLDPAAVTAALQSFIGRKELPQYAALQAYAQGEELAAVARVLP